jgi:tetraacyldisaccharide 4'-kinase
LDALDAFGGEQPLPLGGLREPLTELARADAFIVTRSDRPFDPTELEAKLDALAGEKPIFYAYHDLTNLLHPPTHTTVPPQRLIDRPVALVCAIARPDRFVDDVKHFRARITFQRVFPDHHRFSQKDIREVFAQARAAGAAWILTTEKDWMRLKRLTIPPEPLLWVVQSRLQFVDEARFLSFLVRAIKES